MHQNISTELIRRYCEDLYQKKIVDSVWSNWRKWSKIEAKKRYCDLDQALTLIAITLLRVEARLDEQKRRKELSRSDINERLAKPDIRPKYEALKSKYESLGFRTGKELCKILGKTSRQLHRAFPGFRDSKLYIVQGSSKARVILSATRDNLTFDGTILHYDQAIIFKAELNLSLSSI